MRRAITYYLSTDRDLSTMLESVVGSWPFVYDAAILDNEGKAILHTNRNLIGKVVPDRPDFQLIQHVRFREKLRLVYSPATVYDVAHAAAVERHSVRQHSSGCLHGFSEERDHSATAACRHLFKSWRFCWR